MPKRLDDPVQRIIERCTVTDDGCWLWPGAHNGQGYGEIRVGYRKHYTHRLVYEAHRGAIPDGMVLDHLCRQPRCANPDHLEAVSQAENVRRGTAGWNMRVKETCPQGHPYDKVVLRDDGSLRQRVCTKCVAAAGKRRDERLRRDRDGVHGRRL